MLNIIITNSETKKKILKNNNEKLNNIKIYTLPEFLNLYYLTYNEETIYYLINKYKIKYEIAKIYLDNLMYIEDKEYISPKLNHLVSIKKELLENKLLFQNKLFKSSLKNKDISIYNIPITKEINLLIEELKKITNVEIKNDPELNNNHTIYELTTMEDEVIFVATKICDLINEGININNIYLTNIDNEYRKIIKRVFPMYNIPISLNEKESIFGTSYCKLFLDNYQSNIEETFNIIKQNISKEEDESIYNKLIDIMNKYTFIDDKLLIKEMVLYDIKHTYIDKVTLSDKVTETSIDNTYNENDYVFLMSFNQGTIPKFYKDEDYLNDKEKQELNISLTVDKNNNIKEKTIHDIKSVHNLIITYKVELNGEECNISNINEVLKYEINTDTKLTYNRSNNYNKIKLTSLLDEYNKYNTITDTLLTLNKHYKLDYKTYDNRFTGIDKKDLHTYLDNNLRLSYTKLDSYFKCPFSYYITHILKLNKYEETFYQLIGTLFHRVLELFNKTELTFDELFEQSKNELNHEFTPKESFFLTKLKKELKFIIDTITNQETFTELHDELHEEKVYTSISGDMKISFEGIIDKIKYKEENGTTIIAIIDYKTGNPNLDLTTVPYGIGMQLPIYLYLAKNNKKLTNVKVAGFFLQKILHNEITVDNDTSYEQAKKKALKLQGFSNIDMDILSKFDTSFMDSNIIQGMKVTKDNNFYYYTKVLSTDQMNLLTDIAEDKIKEGAKLIEEAEFNIEPKQIDNNLYGCSYCNFKDICFVRNADIKKLPKLQLKDIIGGDDNETDTGTSASN